MKKSQKKDLYYAICKDKSVDVVVVNYPYRDDNFKMCNYQTLLKMYPRKEYNYIKGE